MRRVVGLSLAVSNSAVAQATEVEPRQQLVVIGTVAPPFVSVNVARAPFPAFTSSPNATTTGEVSPVGAAMAGFGATVSTVQLRVAGAEVEVPALAVTANVCLP